jgi:hypothetical protein
MDTLYEDVDEFLHVFGVELLHSLSEWKMSGKKFVYVGGGGDASAYLAYTSFDPENEGSIFFSEMSLNLCQNTRRDISEVRILHSHCRKNVKPIMQSDKCMEIEQTIILKFTFIIHYVQWNVIQEMIMNSLST